MAVTVPATDVVNYALQAEITTIGTLITANPQASNLLQLQQLQQSLQAQLVNNLISGATVGAGGGYGGGSFPSHLTPSGILSAGTINT
jgi:hypothetical protein